MLRLYKINIDLIPLGHTFYDVDKRKSPEGQKYKRKETKIGLNIN